MGLVVLTGIPISRRLERVRRLEKLEVKPGISGDQKLVFIVIQTRLGDCLV